jgi:hypothetical protein
VTDRGWKQFERRLARQLGTQRLPVTGERAVADFRDGMFAYQAKLGRRCPVYLREWLAGIVAAGDRRGLVGVVVWKPKGTRDRDALVVVRFREWCELHVGSRRSAPGRPLTASGSESCERCGASFTVATRGHGNRRRFCSPRCRILAWAERVA